MFSDEKGFKPVMVYDSNYAFDFSYNVTNFIKPGQGSMAIYTSECRSEGGTILDTMGSSIRPGGASTDTNTTGNNEGFKKVAVVAATTTTTLPQVTDPIDIEPNKQITMRVELDPRNFAANPAIFNKMSDEISTIKFCLIFSLHALGADGSTREAEVNFQETEVTLNVNLQDKDAEFTLEDVSLAAKGKTSASDDVSYTPEAYVCAQNTNAPLTKTFNQGDVINICIKPDEASQTQGGTGLVMNKIEELKFTLNGGNGVTQTALPTNNLGLSDHDPVMCEDKTFCSVSTILSSSFFADAGTVAVEGKASLKFLGGQRRLNEGRRSLQDNGVQATAPFDMTFGVTQSDDGPSMALMAGGNGNSLLTNTISLIVMMGSVFITTVAITILI